MLTRTGAAGPVVLDGGHLGDNSYDAVREIFG
jgi:hypothetical protein